MHPMKAKLIAATCACVCWSAASAEGAAVLFQDNFDSGQSEMAWHPPNLSGPDASVDFAFDYSTLGIPSAPNSVGGTTRGMRFLVNQGFDPATTDGTFQGISASPLDQHFTGDFIIQFDAWMNFVGPLPQGGVGSTQMATFGWGTTGTSVQWAGSNHSIIFAASGDGGTSSDYRVYRVGGGAPLSPSENPGVYAAGDISAPAASDSRNNVNPYYAPLGGKTTPAAQVSLFPNQAGTTAEGTFGMAWRNVVIEKAGDSISWTVDGLRIATVPLQGIVPGGDNILFGMFDINATSSTDPNDFLNAAIYDNILVTVPEPSSLLLLGSALALASTRRRRRDSADRLLLRTPHRVDSLPSLLSRRSRIGQ